MRNTDAEPDTYTDTDAVTIAVSEPDSGRHDCSIRCPDIPG